MASLKDKTIDGFKWSLIDTFAKQGAQFIFGIILARLLNPIDFGLIGIIIIFIAISDVFIYSGFSQALIRKNNCSQSDYSTVFYFNLIVGVLFYFVLFFSAGSIVSFFKEPKLFYLIRVFGIILIINCIGIIQRTILIKRINFKLLAKISIISTIISGALGVWMAYNGWGVWSLVWKAISQSLVTTLFLWLWTRWRPVFIISISSFRELFDFGYKLLLSGILNTAFRKIYHLIIAKNFSTVELGYYTRADEFKNIPSLHLYGVIGRVAYPALASIQNDNKKLKAGYKKLLRLTMLISFVLMIGLAAVSRPMILTLIGEKWLPSVIYLQILCFVGMLYPLHGFNLDILLIKGRSDLFLRLEIIKNLLIAPTIIIGVYYGIKIMLMLMVVNSCIAFVLNSYWSGKIINYPTTEQIADILPSFIVAVLMGGVVYPLGNFLPFSPMSILIIQIITGALIATCTAYVLCLNTFLELKAIFLQFFIKLKA
jgi:teichuronic acid exporter